MALSASLLTKTSHFTGPSPGLRLVLRGRRYAGRAPYARAAEGGLAIMWQEFKEFAMKGNALDLAIGVIIGAAFTPIVGTLVNNILMPVIGYITAGVNFANLTVVPIEGIEIKYGLFLNAIVQFCITAVALFFLIKGINMLRKPKATAPPAPPQSEIYLKEIRDALVKAK
jgi:large conductance mechanosensitive channel